MSLNRLLGAPLVAAAFPRIIRIVVGQGVANNPNIAININNININNNNNDDPTDVSLVRMRTRLFRVLFFRMAVIYALTVPHKARKCIEWAVLAMAFLSLIVLCHLHWTFIRTPITCLDHIQNEWPRDGILRVQILNDPHQDNDESPEVSQAVDDAQQLFNQSLSAEFKSGDKELTTSTGEELAIEVEHVLSGRESSEYYTNVTAFGVKDLIDYSNQINNQNENNGYPQPLKDKVSHLQMIARAVWPHESYIIEYSLEYGFLRLSARSRQRLKIPIKVVTLDPRSNQCFGDVFSRTLLSNFLGYDDILMSSLKNLAEKENNRGYVRNVITGEHYRFVNIWMTRASYIAAAFIMLVFTLSISMLLRYSHHQVFVFVAQLMHTLESNVQLTYQTFPAAPLLTVILALVGMEAIMSEFFNDTTTAFYVILIVWLADQFDAMCSHTVLTRRHWLRFFYLYHFAFYAYDYRFNGQYSGLALLTSWLFIQHSMIFFFHSYELPHILSQTHPITIEATVRPHTPAPDPDTHDSHHSSDGHTDTDGSNTADQRQEPSDDTNDSNDSNRDQSDANMPTDRPSADPSPTPAVDTSRTDNTSIESTLDSNSSHNNSYNSNNDNNILNQIDCRLRTSRTDSAVETVKRLPSIQRTDSPSKSNLLNNFCDNRFETKCN